jgi:NAD(P)-dependent dehydrogenase (short-subunit alcohol dehydrogenase family)
VAAGLTRTNFWSKLGMSDEVQAAMFADGERSMPLRHVAAPEEIAHALLFAATNPYTAGTILDPNGGLHLGRVSAQSEEPSFGSVRGIANNR